MGKGTYDNQGYPQDYPPGYPQDYSQGYPQSYPMNTYNQPITSASAGPQNSTNTNIIQVGGMQQESRPHQTTVVLQKNERMPGMCGHICFSCIVYWLFNPLFGCIAFFIAIGGTNASTPAYARELGCASLGMNITGLLIGIAWWILVALVFTGVVQFAFLSAYNFSFL